jgi:hypothetical protein
MNNKNYTWAEALGAIAGLLIVALVAFILSAVLMIPVAWIVHWILVNLFNYTVLTLWQVWGIILGVRLVFSGFVTVNKN